jgi:hypothetical protein
MDFIAFGIFKRAGVMAAEPEGFPVAANPQEPPRKERNLFQSMRCRVLGGWFKIFTLSS